MQSILNKVKVLIFSKHFWIGIVFAIGIFSRYIFGDNNLAEQISEFLIKTETGVEIDFSAPLLEKH